MASPTTKAKARRFGRYPQGLLKASRMSYIINNYVNKLYETYKIMGEND